MPDTFSILHLSTGKPLRGGERQAMFLHNGLLKKGHNSLLVCKAKGELSNHTISQMQSIPWFGEGDLMGFLRLYNLCKKKAPTFIHCHDAHALFHGSIIAALLHVPTVYTRRVLFALHSNFISRWKYARCDAIIAVSNVVAQQCRSLISGGKIHVVHDGVDWKTPLLSRSEARRSLGLPEDCFIIGTAGHFTREKNVSFAVSLSRSFWGKYPKVKIVCIGPVDLQEKSLPDNLVLAGYKPDAVLYYNAFDLYISTSVREGLGSALIDAVVRDIPAVALDAGGTRDIFPDAWPLSPENSPELFIASVKSAIDNFAKAKSDAVLCGKHARDLFSIDLMVDSTLSVYQEILNNNSPTS